MPQCIECGCGMKAVINPETQTVNRCPSCDLACDTYYEFDVVQRWIDISLLRRRAWSHILFNEEALYYHIEYIIAIVCCGFEAFVVRSLDVMRAAERSPQLASLKEVKGAAALSSLNLFRIISSPLFPYMHYMDSLPRLFFFSIQELVLLAVTAAWMGNMIQSRSSIPLRRWVFVVALAAASKTTYTFFLFWMTPTSLLPIVDGIFVLWLARGFRTILVHHSWFLTFLCVGACVLTRVLLRFATKWSPQLLVL